MAEKSLKEKQKELIVTQFNDIKRTAWYENVLEQADDYKQRAFQKMLKASTMEEIARLQGMVEGIDKLIAVTQFKQTEEN